MFIHWSRVVYGWTWYNRIEIHFFFKFILETDRDVLSLLFISFTSCHIVWCLYRYCSSVLRDESFTFSVYYSWDVTIIEQQQHTENSLVRMFGLTSFMPQDILSLWDEWCSVKTEDSIVSLGCQGITPLGAINTAPFIHSVNMQRRVLIIKLKAGTKMRLNVLFYAPGKCTLCHDWRQALMFDLLYIPCSLFISQRGLQPVAHKVTLQKIHVQVTCTVFLMEIIVAWLQVVIYIWISPKHDNAWTYE